MLQAQRDDLRRASTAAAKFRLLTADPGMADTKRWPWDLTRTKEFCKKLVILIGASFLHGLAAEESDSITAFALCHAYDGQPALRCSLSIDEDKSENCDNDDDDDADVDSADVDLVMMVMMMLMILMMMMMLLLLMMLLMAMMMMMMQRYRQRPH